MNRNMQAAVPEGGQAVAAPSLLGADQDGGLTAEEHALLRAVTAAVAHPVTVRQGADTPHRQAQEDMEVQISELQKALAASTEKLAGAIAAVCTAVCTSG